jgi:hypothetical protein
MEEKFFDLLGLGVPFYLAAATYTVFAWLDSNASEDATKVISSWLHGRSQDKPDLGKLIISAFDRIYTSPLLSFRAFRRSATISSIIFTLMIVVPAILNFIRVGSGILIGGFDLFTPVLSIVALYFFVTVLSDYMSLPFVRRFLQLAQIYPIMASAVSSIIGLVVIATSFLLFIVGTEAAVSLWLSYSVHGPILIFSKEFVISIFRSVESLSGLSEFVSSMRPAFITHLWLPLFALSTLIARLVFWILRAVGWAQWFLKQGDAHPLKAVGMVATIIVFGSAMLVKEGWALLGVLERS